MPNLDLWINQNSNNEDTTTISNFENCLLSIRNQYQKIGLNSDHPISNERYEKIIERYFARGGERYLTKRI